MSSPSLSVVPNSEEVHGESESPKKAASISVPDADCAAKESFNQESVVSAPETPPKEPSSPALTAEESSKDSPVVSASDNAPSPTVDQVPVDKAASRTEKGSSMASITSKSSRGSEKSPMAASSLKGKETSIVDHSANISKRSKMVSLHFRRTARPTAGADVIRGMKWVIFPDNKWIRRWDMVVLTALFLLVFILPYQIGISGGVTILINIPWLVFNVVLNSIFFVDTFLYFFRAYYSKNGSLVLDLKKIRKQYLRTYFVPNFISVLPFTLGYYIVGTIYIKNPADPNSSVEAFLTFIQFASMLKLIRLTRAKKILSSSETVTTFRMKRNSQMIQLWTYVWMIVVVSHWFACTWSLVAFIETESFGEEQMLETPNWISFWFSGNAVPGGLNPVGWENHIDRYVLSLFWAIQTITSIGYGNIVPVTRAEYFVACAIQLCAGVMWAYVIGGLVSVAAGMQVRAETYRTRIDQANKLISEFSDPVHVNEDDEDNHVIINNSKRVGKRIRKYIHKQFTRSKGDSCVNTIPSVYPAFETLSPELQREASVLIMNQYLDAVPYLSSTFMSQHAQSLVSMESVMLEFASGEVINTQNAVEDLGRGIYVFKRGCAFNLDKTLNRKVGNKLEIIGLITAGMAYGAGKVLLEDGNKAANGKLQFLTFSQVMFIPRRAVLDAIETSELAWRECARWVYFRTLLVAKAEEYMQEKSK